MKILLLGSGFFGFITKLSLLLSFSLFPQWKYVTTRQKADLKLKALDIYGDSVQVSLRKVTPLILLKEPACTGCKEDLFHFLTVNKRNLNTPIILLSAHPDIVQRKVYEKHLNLLLPIKHHVIYSTQADSFSCLLNNLPYKVAAAKTPALILISASKDSFCITSFPYDTLFTGIRLNPNTEGYILKNITP